MRRARAVDDIVVARRVLRMGKRIVGTAWERGECRSVRSAGSAGERGTERSPEPRKPAELLLLLLMLLLLLGPSYATGES